MPIPIGEDFKNIFSGINPDYFKKVDLQESFFKQLLDYSIERSYLNEIVESMSSPKTDELLEGRTISWIRIDRLPINPSSSDDYDLMTRWQGALSALHSWGQKVIFLLLRYNGYTNIFIGTESPYRGISAKQAAEHMCQAMSSTMPGIDISVIDKDSVADTISIKLMELNAAGAITGIPSLRKQTKRDIFQTLDALAFGLHDSFGDKNYAMVVVAEPITDDEITDIISRYRSTGNSVHNFVKQTVTNTEGQSNNAAVSMGSGAIIQHLLRFAGVAKFSGFAAAAGVFSTVPEMIHLNLGNFKRNTAGFGGGLFVNRGYGHNISQGVNIEYLNKFAAYSEELIDKHIDRLKRGRNYGFWNVGTYILGSSDSEVDSVMGILRTIYSGEDSFIEPIRLHHFSKNIINNQDQFDECKNDACRVSFANIIKSFQLIPLPTDFDNCNGNLWHPLGKHYQYLSTTLNTEELSVETSLPRKDVPGLRFVKTMVRFANNPAKVDSKDIIRLGNIIDTGVMQKNTYQIDFNALVKHCLISGTTGMGKSTTCRRIIREVLDHNVPVLVMEPAKDEYVRWAIQYNKSIDDDKKLSEIEKKSKKFSIYMPGVSEIDGYQLEQLKINPFEPAAMQGASIDMLSHCEQLITILNASLPTSDVLPIIIDESVYTYLKSYYYDGFISGSMKQKEKYVKLEGLPKIAEGILKQRGYEEKVRDNLMAAVRTRFEYLIRGKRGDVLNVSKSTNFNTLFSGNVIINFSKVSAKKDKALIMSLLTLALYEYRTSECFYNELYRKKAQSNKLLHLTVIEEAHNLLAKPSPDFGRSGDSQQISSEMFSNILSEIRAYGEGIMIVDQVPTKLIPDSIKNTNYKITHRLVAPDDADVMAAALSLRGEQKALIGSLGLGEAIVFGDSDDAAAWIKIRK